MDVQVGHAELRDDRGAERHTAEQNAEPPAARLHGLGPEGDFAERALETEGEEHARRVGRELNASADLAELSCLLEQRDRNALASERDRGRQTADPAPHDDGAQRQLLEPQAAASFTGGSGWLISCVSSSSDSDSRWWYCSGGHAMCGFAGS